MQGVIGDDWASIKANKADWLREKKIRILMQTDRCAGIRICRTFRWSASSPPARPTARVLDLFVARQQYGRPFLAPPDTPAPIIAAWRDAFEKVANDPEFIRAAAQAQLIIKLASGDEMAALVNRIYDNPKPVIEQATAILRSIPE